MLLPRRWLPALLLLAAAAAAMPPALFAQSQTQTGEDDTRLPLQEPPPVTAPEPLAARLCDALHAVPEARRGACCGIAKPARGLADECARVLSDALRANRARLDPAAVEGCERESAAAFAGCDWVSPLAPAAPAACRGLVAGLVEAGAACASALECRPGLACRGTSAATRVCSPPGAPGTACGGPGELLATYVKELRPADHPECEGYCLQGRCAAAVAVGGGCLSTLQCAAGSHCAAGRCVAGDYAAVARKRTGESCGGPFECLAACNVPAGAETGTCGPRCAPYELPVDGVARTPR
jgi:hypothetical protein